MLTLKNCYHASNGNCHNHNDNMLWVDSRMVLCTHYGFQNGVRGPPECSKGSPKIFDTQKISTV